MKQSLLTFGFRSYWYAAPAPTLPPLREWLSLCTSLYTLHKVPRPFLNWKIAARVFNLLGTARRHVVHGDAAAASTISYDRTTVTFNTASGHSAL